MWKTFGFLIAFSHLTGVSQAQNQRSPYQYNVSLNDSTVSLALAEVKSYRATAGLYKNWTDEGPDESYIKGLADYWANDYNWTTVQTQLNNQFKYYYTTVPGNGNYTEDIPLSFIHEQSSDPEAVPLLLIHGWPSTSLEWRHVVKSLTLKNGSSPAFHVVAVDLPGYGFSPAPKSPGMGVREMGVAFDAMMKQLGYDTYGIGTTDLGWFIGLWMVHDVGNSIRGHFFDFWYPMPTDADIAAYNNNQSTPEEAAVIKSLNAWSNDHAAYLGAHSEKPLALSLALTDSPVGFLGWYLDVNHATSDGYQKSSEDVITDGLLLWAPGPYTNVRLYKSAFSPLITSFPTTNIPSGMSQWGWSHGPFPELSALPYTPRSWVQRTAANLTFFTRHQRGGHFPAFYCPGPWVNDIKTFFSGL